MKNIVLFLEPNNFLGIQYIIAAMKQGSNFEWHTTKRINGNHNQIEDTTGTLFSSSYLRKLFFEDATRLKDSLPDTLYIPYINQLETGYFSASFENVYPLIKWNLKHQKYDSKIGNCGGGLIQLIQKNILKAHSFSELVDLSSNKKYTKSRVRRAIRDYLFGISYETLSISPNFSFVLGISETGQNVLKMIKYNTAFPCIVKPSDAKTIVGPNNVLLNLQTKADEFYTLTTLKPLPLDYFMKCKPYIKK